MILAFGEGQNKNVLLLVWLIDLLTANHLIDCDLSLRIQRFTAELIMEYDGPDGCLFHEVERYYPFKKPRVNKKPEPTKTPEQEEKAVKAGTNPKKDKVPVERSVTPLQNEAQEVTHVPSKGMHEWYDKTVDRETIVEGCQPRRSS